MSKTSADELAVEVPVDKRCSTPRALIEFMRALAGMRRHDLRAARTWITTMYPGKTLPRRLWLFLQWALDTMWRKIPDALEWAQFQKPVSRTPVWLAEGDPFENHPWKDNPAAKLPAESEVAVIGAGFIGSSVAYHWSKHGKAPMVVLEMGGVASGSAGRNEGLVVMGRYYHLVYSTVLAYLEGARQDFTPAQRDSLAHEFAAAYARAAYANAEMIEQTIQEEKIDCDYVRKGWVQASDADHVHQLETSARVAQET